jgi:hypothetical protein
MHKWFATPHEYKVYVCMMCSHVLNNIIKKMLIYLTIANFHMHIQKIFEIDIFMQQVSKRSQETQLKNLLLITLILQNHILYDDTQ